MTEGRDTTADSKFWNAGDTHARDLGGNIVDIPEPRLPVTGPSVDKEEITDDNGEVEELVEQQKENQETGENKDPDPAE